MRKLNYTGKICVVLCAILCVGSLSGCSTAMQSLTDGADAVLNGLADGTDIVLNGLSEGADQALGGLSAADDGQAKDSIVKAFGELVGDAGNAALTPQNKLQGHKENGADDYTGSYEATYSEFTGTEILFGGTTLEREAGSTIHITCSLAVLRWSEKQEVQSTSPVHFLSKAAKQQFFFAQGQMIRLFFSRRAVSTMAQ